MTPVNLRVTACANGGRSNGRLAYPAATSPYSSCAMGVAVIVHGPTSSKRISKSWCRTRAWRCGSRTIHPSPSKYNPIEHRLSPPLTRACQGVIFTSVDVVQELMAKATTKTGLEVSVNILNKEYATGRKVAADFKEQIGSHL